MPLEVDFKSRMSIGQLAARVGLRTSAIRYYERIGLLPRAERVSGRRVYGVDAAERLERIALAQQAGFSLDEVRLLEQGLGGERKVLLALGVLIGALSTKPFDMSIPGPEQRGDCSLSSA